MQDPEYFERERERKREYSREFRARKKAERQALTLGANTPKGSG